eukprot:m51a1_g7752 putative family 3 adenylate cyclase (801) ;mRNA; f:51646-56486
MRAALTAAPGDARVRVAGALAAVVAAAAVAMAVALWGVAGTQLRAMEGRQAAAEAALLHGALCSQLDALRTLLLPHAHWDAVYEYLEQRDPVGPVWVLFTQGYDFLEANDLEAALFVLPNGTMLNGFMWGPGRRDKVRASETLSRQVGALLLSTGSSNGLFWIPETDTPVVVQSEAGRPSFGTSDDVGWVVFARNTHSLLRPIVEVANLCLSFGAQLTCSSAANQTHDTYLATGVVLSDEQGVPRVYTVIRGIRSDATTLNTYNTYIISICCSALLAIVVLVYLLMELSVLRILSHLIMAEDMAINFESDGDEWLLTRLLKSLRLGAAAGMTVLLAVSVAALSVFLSLMLSASARELIQNRAVADGTRISNVLNQALNDLMLQGGTYASWDDPVNYVSQGMADGKFWDDWVADGSAFARDGVDGVIYFLPDGTVLNSIGFNYAESRVRNITSEEMETTRLAASYPVCLTQESPVLGWVVLLKDIARLLPAKAEMLNMQLLMLAMQDSKLLSDKRRLFGVLLCIEIALLVFVIAGSTAAMELLIFRGLSRLSRAIATGTSTSKGSVTFSGNNQLQRMAYSINVLIMYRDIQHKQSLDVIQMLFPVHVFSALQEGTMPNERHDMASILFSDLIGFRDWATAASPDAVSQFLSSFTEGLDAVVEQCCATKIKTILDTYMAASGVPAATPQHAHVMLQLALEMHKYSQGKSFSGTEGVSMRIGVSSGPCAGGIIGKQSWVYDLWSDTVNMAARLKAKAAPGTVLCDELTYALTADAYAYEEAREVELKGKGVQRVHTLVGPRPL